MSRYLVGYCSNCTKTTKQEVVQCHDSVPYRIFETIFTLGFGLMFWHDYECECTKCGHINTIRRY